MIFIISRESQSWIFMGDGTVGSHDGICWNDGDSCVRCERLHTIIFKQY